MCSSNILNLTDIDSTPLHCTRLKLTYKGKKCYLSLWSNGKARNLTHLGLSLTLENEKRNSSMGLGNTANLEIPLAILPTILISPEQMVTPLGDVLLSNMWTYIISQVGKWGVRKTKKGLRFFVRIKGKTFTHTGALIEESNFK